MLSQILKSQVARLYKSAQLTGLMLAGLLCLAGDRKSVV